MSDSSGSDDKLKSIACPDCGTVGSIKLGTTLVARPLGSWSLAGQQLKVSTRETTALVCTAPGCHFHKLPKGAHADRGSSQEHGDE